MAIYGIDISSYQGNISDLGSDIDFVIIKVTQGTDNVSSTWQEQRDVARRDGKIVLYYHFANDVNNQTAEAQHFLNTIGNSRLPNEGACWDWETGGYSDAVDAGGATFFDIIKQNWGVNTFPYSNAARINSGPWPRLTARHAPLWEAAYASSPPSPAPFPVIAIWQYTSSGSEQGISGAVDKDQFNGTREQLIQSIGGDQMNATLDEARILALTILGRDGRQGRPDAINGASDADLNANHVGQPLDSVEWTMWNSDEAKSYREKTLPAAFDAAAQEAALQKQVADLQAELAAQPPQAEPTSPPAIPTEPTPLTVHVSPEPSKQSLSRSVLNFFKSLLGLRS